MKMRTFLFVGLFVGLCALLFVGLESEEVCATDIVVDYAGNGDYLTIQEGIDNSSDTDTVYVWSGTYVENITVNKQISLVGNGSSSTFIDCGGASVGVMISVDWVNVSNVNVSDCTTGVLFWSVENIVVEDCIFWDAIICVRFYGSNYSRASNNSFFNYQNFAVYSTDSHDNTYDGNCFSSMIGFAGGGGLYLESEYDSDVLDNVFYRSWWFIHLLDCHYVYFSNNSDTSPLGYAPKRRVEMDGCTHNTFVGLSVYLVSGADAIRLFGGSDYNSFSGSYFISGKNGVLVENGDRNHFYDNYFAGHTQTGMNFGIASNNTVYNNSFRHTGVHISNGVNTNYFSYFGVGNLYDDYYSPDNNHDGVVDVARSWGGGSYDYFPLSVVANISSPVEGMLFYVVPYTLFVWSNGTHNVDNFTWDWGDGNITYGGASASHTYTYEDDFVINLTAKNSIIIVSSYDNVSITFMVGTKVKNVDTGFWYPSIQVAINESNDGESLCVYEDCVERVLVDKELTIMGVDVTVDGFGGIAFLVDANDVILSGLTITNSSVGVSVTLSTGVVVLDNVIVNNSIGVSVGLSSDSTLRNNTLSINGVGVSMLGTSQDNHIYYNRFENNTVQAVDDGTNNLWDDGVATGNTWSDYEGEDRDRDGIGDTELPHHGDRYPLTDRRPSPADQLYYDAKNILYVTIVILAITSVIGVLFATSSSGKSYFRRRRI